MPKTRPDPLTKEEVEAILSEAYKDQNDYAYTIFVLAKKTGKRLGEMYAMQVKDYLPDKKIIYTKILKRKKQVDKETIIDDEVCRVLDRWIALKKLKLDDFLFHQMTYRTIQTFPKKYAKMAGINKNVMMHSFRHYFITSLVRMGWTYDRIMKLTGHANIATLGVYDSATAMDLEKDARDALKNI